jgi:hypothetical protein
MILKSRLVWFIPICVGLLWPAILFANTAIIAVYTPEFVMIGADSLLVATGTHRHQFGCKIGETNKIFWASSGMNKTVDNAPVNFDIDRIASEAVKSSHDFAGAIAAFESSARRAIPPVLEWLAISIPSAFAKQLGGDAVSIVFAGVDHNEVRMSTVELKVDPNSNAIAVGLTTSRHDCPGADCITPIALGTIEAMQAEAARELDIWQKLGAVPAIRKLIAVEIAAKPDIVGGPLTILKITPAGLSWPEVGECQYPEPN